MTDIMIPNLGNEISEAEIAEWLVGIGEEVDLAVDPVEGTNFVAKNLPGGISVLAKK